MRQIFSRLIFAAKIRLFFHATKFLNKMTKIVLNFVFLQFQTYKLWIITRKNCSF